MCFYKLIEWWVAIISGASAEAFLFTQEYAWDTQSDMVVVALLGAMLSIVLFAKLHDNQLKRKRQNN
ncbi:MAG: DUF2238 domain-containing protein [Piscirickettsiaceae bacterium]|nr:DUF2238 domain-containing protein [Piscirickettsiaceae bacterium]